LNNAQLMTHARLRNDLYCVEWNVKLYYTIPYLTHPFTSGMRDSKHACDKAYIIFNFISPNGSNKRKANNKRNKTK